MDGPKLLSAFLADRQLTMRAFGAKVRAPASLVCRWANGEGTPGVDYALAISDATEGAVPFAAWARRKAARRSAARRGSRRASRRSAARLVGPQRHEGSIPHPKP